MQPRRPDSAKSRTTQKTLDTQLNQSKFSQTFTSYTSFDKQKKDQFLKYLEEKDKDPKFKKYQQTNLPQIPQKAPKNQTNLQKQQLSKINSKPFQKRSSRIVQKNKPQQQKTTRNQKNLPNNATKHPFSNNNNIITRKQSQQQSLKRMEKNNQSKQPKVQMNSTTKSFAQKNKQKMSLISSNLKKTENEEKKVEKKIDFKGFKVNQPGRKEVSGGSRKMVEGQIGNEVKLEERVNVRSQVRDQFLVRGEEEENEFMVEEGQINGVNKSAGNNSLSNPNNAQNKRLKVQQKTQQQKQQQQKQLQQQKQRQQRLLQISRFINQVQTKNMQNYPQGYEQFVQKNESRIRQDSQMSVMLQKINIGDFLVEPTESDYLKVQRRIRENQIKLMSGQDGQWEDSSQIGNKRPVIVINTNNNNANTNQTPNRQFNTNKNTSQLSQQSSSIDLDRIIDGDSSSISASRVTINRLKQQQQQQDLTNQNEQNEIFLSSISSKDLKERNLFLTEILKGRVTHQEIQKLQQLNKSQLKLHRLEHNDKQLQDDQYQEPSNNNTTEYNFTKKNYTKIIQRNYVQASGQIYRNCDYLSEEHKLRLQRLLNEEIEQSPFILSEREQFALRRIDEGIRLYRELSVGRSEQQTSILPSSQLLPKDPILRKQAQKKILRQKLTKINQRLQQIQQIVVSQQTIQQLIQQYRHLSPSGMSQKLVDERNDQIRQIEEKSKQAKERLLQAQRQKQEIQQTLKEMELEFGQYERQCREYEQLSVQEIVAREKEEISKQKLVIQKIEGEMAEIQRQTEQSMGEFQREIMAQMEMLAEIEGADDKGGDSQVVIIMQPTMTVEELDRVFESKLKLNPELNAMLNKMENQQAPQQTKNNNNNTTQEQQQQQQIETSQQKQTPTN